MLKTLTIEELAEDAFLKGERLRALEVMGTPTDFEQRKQAFIELARARVAAADSTARLEAVIRNPSGNPRWARPAMQGDQVRTQ